MTEKTKDALQHVLRYGGSSGKRTETQLLIELKKSL